NLRSSWQYRTGDQQGVPALTAERRGHRGGQGPHRGGRVLQPELTGSDTRSWPAPDTEDGRGERFVERGERRAPGVFPALDRPVRGGLGDGVRTAVAAHRAGGGGPRGGVLSHRSTVEGAAAGDPSAAARQREPGPGLHGADVCGGYPDDRDQRAQQRMSTEG